MYDNFKKLPFVLHSTQIVIWQIIWFPITELDITSTQVIIIGINTCATMTILHSLPALLPYLCCYWIYCTNKAMLQTVVSASKKYLLDTVSHEVVMVTNDGSMTAD